MNKIKVNDKVKVQKGKDAGKTGKIIQTFPDLGLVVVEGLNIRYKHLKAKNRGQSGERIEFSAPMRHDNVMLVCSRCSKPTRVGFRFLEDKKKVRICKKCSEIID